MFIEALYGTVAAQIFPELLIIIEAWFIGL
jgi:hypothetical protein